jgi:hypothetical protein
VAFLLYKKTKLDAAHRYDCIRNVTLAGRKNGLIHASCEKYLKARDVGWTISSKDMLKAAECDPATHALVIDTAPSRSRLLNLFEIKSISGYSYSGWTPLMLTFEELFADKPGSVREIVQLKQKFSDAECTRRIVREFLYLLGGYEGGVWTWGGNSRTTAALLWPEAWRYFQRQI